MNTFRFSDSDTFNLLVKYRPYMYGDYSLFRFSSILSPEPRRPPISYFHDFPPPRVHGISMSEPQADRRKNGPGHPTPARPPGLSQQHIALILQCCAPKFRPWLFCNPFDLEQYKHSLALSCTLLHCSYS